MTTKAQSLVGVEGIHSSKKLENNTFEVKYKNGVRAIRLHYTNIVIFYPDGTTHINSGGWLTRTTKDRINKYCGFIKVWQEKGEWYVANNTFEFPVHFADWMMFSKTGEHIGCIIPLKYPCVRQ